MHVIVVGVCIYIYHMAMAQSIRYEPQHLSDISWYFIFVRYLMGPKIWSLSNLSTGAGSCPYHIAWRVILGPQAFASRFCPGTHWSSWGADCAGDQSTEGVGGELGLAGRDVRYDKNWFCKLLPKGISRFYWVVFYIWGFDSVSKPYHWFDLGEVIEYVLTTTLLDFFPMILA